MGGMRGSTHKRAPIALKLPQLQVCPIGSLSPFDRSHHTSRSIGEWWSLPLGPTTLCPMSENLRGPLNESFALISVGAFSSLTRASEGSSCER